MKTKYLIKNYIPLKNLKDLHSISQTTHQFFVNLKTFDVKSLASILIIRNLLFILTNTNPQKMLSLVELSAFVSKCQCLLYNFKNKGFVNGFIMEKNEVFNIFRSLYPSFSDIFRKPKINNLFEIEHFHNLIILILIFEIDNYISIWKPLLKSYKKTKAVDLTIQDKLEDELVILKTTRCDLTKVLSGGIRSSLSKNRVIITERIYSGFDTEYQNIDSMTNQLLCYTHASLSEVILRVKTDRVDFSLKHGSLNNSLPVTSNVISELIKQIRILNNKNDSLLLEIESKLSEKYQIFELASGDKIFKKKEQFTPAEIKTEYHDMSLGNEYSLKKLVTELTQGFKLKERDVLKQLLAPLKVTIQKECFLSAHFTTADISSFVDFNEIKEKFAVLNKSFVGLDKTLRIHGWRVILRDTSLLSPGGMSLKSISELYSQDLQKIQIGDDMISNMKEFKRLNPSLFKKYAIQDSIITLWHTINVQDSFLKFSGKYTIPVTLSSLAASYLDLELNIKGEGRYHPKTLNGLYGVRDLAKLNTPIGIELSNDLHSYIDYFLGSYHGGRNESYLYGVLKGNFYDYDLPGAYSTAMSLLDYPDWENKIVFNGIKTDEFMEKYGVFLIKSYTSLKIEFEFPDDVKYPNLPVRLDTSSVLFPLSGVTFCTGLELLLALKLRCKIKIIGGVFIPFIKNEKEVVHPVKKEIVNIKHPLLQKISKNLESTLSQEEKVVEKELKLEASDNYKILQQKLLGTQKGNESFFFYVVQRLILERQKYPKGSYNNLLYKFIANAGIGQMARGLNQKTSFDTSTKTTRVIPPGQLISPLYAGWITSFIRTTLSELLNKHSHNDIISCTTDGFICSQKDLEKIQDYDFDSFSHLYVETRNKLTGVKNSALLEQKYHESKGVISWRTRGQLGLSGGIKALTGYQRTESIEMIIEKIHKSFNTTKQITFLQKSLRSAKEIFLTGGHSTQKLQERSFNLKFDNRREITNEKNGYFETKPFINTISASQNRLIASLGNRRFRLYNPVSSNQLSGDAYLNLTRRMIVRLLRNGQMGYSLSRLEVYKIMKQLSLPCTKNFISKQKDLFFIFNSIPKTEKTLEVLTRFSVIFPNFDINSLIR